MTLRRIVELRGWSSTATSRTAAREQRGRRAAAGHGGEHAGGRRLVVDVKTPLDAYLAAVEAVTDEARAAALRRHAQAVSDRVRSLASKAYWAQFEHSPDFVVLFIPGDQFLAAALDELPTLLEDAIRQHVILTTPSSLVALLKAVAYGCGRTRSPRTRRASRRWGEDLYRRLARFTGHLARLGRSLAPASRPTTQRSAHSSGRCCRRAALRRARTGRGRAHRGARTRRQAAAFAAQPRTESLRMNEPGRTDGRGVAGRTGSRPAPGSRRHLAVLSPDRRPREALGPRCNAYEAELQRVVAASPTRRRIARLQWWRGELDRLAAGRPRTRSPARCTARAGTGARGEPAARSARRRRPRPRPLHLPDWNELEAYCCRAGGALQTLIAATLSGVRPLSGKEREFARRLGSALRQAEMLQRLPLDAGRGHLYAPLDVLHDLGIDPASLGRGEPPPRSGDS